MSNLPTLTINEVSDGIQDVTTCPTAKKVLEGMLNDFMDLQYGKQTPYTTGKQVIPTGVTLEDVEKAASDEAAEKKFRDVYTKIVDTYKSGDLTPQSPNWGWDPRLTPVLVLIGPNK